MSKNHQANVGSGEMASRDDELIPIEKHPTFYAVAYTSFLQAKRLVDERVRYQRALEQEGRQLTEDDREFLAINSADEECSAVVTVIFSALALEAFINDYAITVFSRSFFDSYLDKLDPVSKWLIFPWLAKGKTIERRGQTFESLKKLLSLRNKLVHFKRTMKRACDFEEDDRITKKHAEDAVRTVRKAVAALKKLDERVSTDWLREAEERSC